MSVKEQFKETIDRLPDDLSAEEVLRHLAFDQSIRRGIADSKAGRVISHEDIKKKYLK